MGAPMTVMLLIGAPWIESLLAAISEPGSYFTSGSVSHARKGMSAESERPLPGFDLDCFWPLISSSSIFAEAALPFAAFSARFRMMSADLPLIAWVAALCNRCSATSTETISTVSAGTSVCG